jgi:hypothetical protein
MPTKAPSSGPSGSWAAPVLRSWLGASPTPEMRRAILAMLPDPLTGKIGLTLWPEQEAALFSTPPPGVQVDQLLLTGAIQSGKSVLTAADVITRIPWWPAGSSVWLIGVTYYETRAERRLLQNWLGHLGWADWPNCSLPRGQNEPWTLATVFGVSITSLSSSRPERLATEAPVHIILAEAGMQTLETLHTARGRATMHNARLLLSGTVERAQPWYPRLVRRWMAPNPEGGRAFVLPAWANRRFYPGGAMDPKILDVKRDLPPDVFARRFAGLPAQPEGLVFKEFNPLIHGRRVVFGERPADAEPWTVYLPPDLPLEVAIDPGFSGSSYAVLPIVEYGGQVIIFDEVHVRGMTHKQVIRACQGKPWWPRVTGGVIDVAGTTHAMAGDPATDTWALPVSEGGANLTLRSQKLPIWQGIDLMHTLLQVDPLTERPGLVVDVSACPRFVWELTEAYQHRTDKDGEVLGEDPVDRRNDACKAVAYWVADKHGPTGVGRRVHYGAGPRALLPWESEESA